MLTKINYLTSYDHPGFVDFKLESIESQFSSAKVQSTTLELSKTIMKPGLNHMSLEAIFD